MIPREPDQNLPGRRQGMASVAVLIALIVLGIVSAAILKVAFARRHELVGEERRLQAAWLVEAGVDRAVARLRASADYAGETWDIPAADLGGRASATVSIRVEKASDHPDRRKVRVQADYPSGSSLRVRQARDVVVAVPSSSR